MSSTARKGAERASGDKARTVAKKKREKLSLRKAEWKGGVGAMFCAGKPGFAKTPSRFCFWYRDVGKQKTRLTEMEKPAGARQECKIGQACAGRKKGGRRSKR